MRCHLIKQLMTVQPKGFYLFPRAKDFKKSGYFTCFLSLSLSLYISWALLCLPVQASEGKKSFSPGHFFGDSQNLVADIAEVVAPSVVNIDVEKSRQTSLQDIPSFPFNEDMLKRFFGYEGDGSPFKTIPSPGLSPGNLGPRKLSSNGSGLVLDQKGHILTNYHVIAQADKITVTFNEGQKILATVIGKDKVSDLAVLQLNPSQLDLAKSNGFKLSPCTLGTSQGLRPGQWVLAIGSPLGFDHTVTLGIISAVSRKVPDINASVDFIQTDAAINPGNSGGPLVNLKGEVIAINTAISGMGQNIGFAIPVDIVKHVSDTLIAGGSLSRPWIGLGMTSLTPELAKNIGLPVNTPGVLVSQVMGQSPAEKAGFLPSDVIQRLEGKQVLEPREIQEQVRQKPIGSPLNFQILRNGSVMLISVKTESLPQEDSASSETSQPDEGGQNAFPDNLKNPLRIPSPSNPPGFRLPGPKPLN
jgi:S1-C subfamily serine protease